MVRDNHSSSGNELAHLVQLLVARLDPLVHHACHGKNTPFHGLEALSPDVGPTLEQQGKKVLKTTEEGHKHGRVGLLGHTLKILESL